MAPRAGAVGHLESVWVLHQAVAVHGHFMRSKSPELIRVGDHRVAAKFRMAGDEPRVVVVKVVPAVRADDGSVFQRSKRPGAHWPFPGFHPHEPGKGHKTAFSDPNRCKLPLSPKDFNASTDGAAMAPKMG